MDLENRLTHEVAHGRYLIRQGAGEVWNWESPAGKERWRRRVELLSSIFQEGDDVLELGCGTGYFTRELAKRDIAITAVDISPDLLEEARKTVASARVRFRIENAYRLTLDNDVFDAVVGSSVLHHLEIEKALAEMYRVLKPGGRIAFTEPNMLNPQIALQKNIRWLKKKLGDSPDETAFFRWKLGRQLRRAGFRNIRVSPFDFLHPSLPSHLIKPWGALGAWAESVCLLREIAGSLFITAGKPV